MHAKYYGQRENRLSADVMRGLKTLYQPYTSNLKNIDIQAAVKSVTLRKAKGNGGARCKRTGKC